MKKIFYLVMLLSISASCIGHTKADLVGKRWVEIPEIPKGSNIIQTFDFREYKEYLEFFDNDTYISRIMHKSSEERRSVYKYMLYGNIIKSQLISSDKPFAVHTTSTRFMEIISLTNDKLILKIGDRQIKYDLVK